MKTKICKTCNVEKDISCFRQSGKYMRNDCKECENRKCKERNKKNKEHIRKKQKEYRQNNKEKIIEYRKKHYNPEEKRKYNKQYRKNHKEYYSNWHKKYYQEYKEQLKDNYNNWKKENPDKIKIYQQRDYKKRMSNPILKVELQLRNMINTSFRRKGYAKSKKLEEIVGLNSKDMIEYLLETFKDNYGRKWDGIEKVHIDHIIPLATAKTKEEVIKLCYYTNLQLLTAKDNMGKGSKIIEKSH